MCRAAGEPSAAQRSPGCCANRKRRAGTMPRPATPRHAPPTASPMPGTCRHAAVEYPPNRRTPQQLALINKACRRDNKSIYRRGAARPDTSVDPLRQGSRPHRRRDERESAIHRHSAGDRPALFPVLGVPAARLASCIPASCNREDDTTGGDPTDNTTRLCTTSTEKKIQASRTKSYRSTTVYRFKNKVQVRVRNTGRTSILI